MTWNGIEPSGYFATSNQDGLNFSIDYEAAAGDVSGLIDNLIVIGIRGNRISQISPASGDVLVFDGVEWSPDVAGTSSSSSGVGPHNLLSSSHLDTLPASPEIGDLIIGSGVPAKWVRFPIGLPNQELVNISGVVQWSFSEPQIIINGSSIILNEYSRRVIINKTVASATTVNLPLSPYVGQEVKIKDGKGDSFTNPITVLPPSGNFIDSFTSIVMRTNYQSLDFLWNGSSWNLI